MMVRKGYLDDELSNELISLDSMKDYFLLQNELYDIFSRDGLQNYILHMLNND